jgi:aminoglycoside phosphotransferase (APT) family kinase protein
MVSVLARLPQWPGLARARVDPLDGGSGNLVLRVRFADEDLVVRQSLPAGPALKLDGEAELAAFGFAARAGVAPRLRAGDGRAGISVLEYVPGVRVLNPGDLNDPSTLGRLVDQLEILHKLDFLPRVFDADSTVRSYLSHATNLEAHYRDELLVLAGEFDREFTGRVFCHNDLMAANILDNGRIWLIDFEYAVCSDPILDLAGAVALNGLGEDARQQLLIAYYGGQGPSMEAFNRVCRMVLLLSLAWADALSDLPGARRQGFRHQMCELLNLFPVRQGR